MPQLQLNIRLLVSALCLSGLTFAATTVQADPAEPPAKAANTEAESDAFYKQFMEKAQAARDTREAGPWIDSLSAACAMIIHAPNDPRVSKPTEDGLSSPLDTLELCAGRVNFVQGMSPKEYHKAAEPLLMSVVKAEVPEAAAAQALQCKAYMTMRLLLAQAPADQTPEQRSAMFKQCFEQADLFH